MLLLPMFSMRDVNSRAVTAAPANVLPFHWLSGSILNIIAKSTVETKRECQVHYVQDDWERVGSIKIIAECRQRGADHERHQ
jgi:hypothetical protein